MRVLLTGASGFLGRHLLPALVRDGLQVRVITRRPLPLHERVEQFEADLAESRDLEGAFQGVDVLVHLAASLQGSREELERNNVEGSRRLLDAMARTATRRLVLASSLSVYDWARVGRTLSEQDPMLDEAAMPRSDAYARTKAVQEHLTRARARELGWTLTVLRPAAIWGAEEWADFVLGKRWRRLQLVVAPSAPARIVYVHNAVAAFCKAVQRERGGELVLNLIDDSGITNWQYARIVREHRGGVLIPLPYTVGRFIAQMVSRISPKPDRLPSSLRPGVFDALHKPVTCGSAAARAALGWHPPFTLREALSHRRTEGEVAWS